MNKTQIAIFAGAAIVVAGALVFTIKSNKSTSTSTTEGQGAIGARSATSPNAVMSEVNPFTHNASILATVDPKTIRFEKLKAVELASKTKTITDEQNCKDKQFRDPDGSGCQTVQVVERVKAVEARYSFVGPELSAGETIPGRQSFSVYFRPEELGVPGPVDKLKREQAEALFQLNTFRPMVEEKGVDKQNTHYCEGNYVDGNWVRKDPNCRDQVQYITQTVPSAYLTVQVDLRHPATVASR
jgi:hypothetical protein